MAIEPVRIVMVELVVTGGHRFSFPCLSKPTRQGDSLWFNPAPTNEGVTLYGGVKESDIIFLVTYDKTEMVEVPDELEDKVSGNE